MFEQDYYINSKISNYKEYPAKDFCGLADSIDAIIRNKSARVLDFGCAIGGLVNGLKVRGYEHVIGTDISYWAVKYGRRHFGLDSAALQFYNLQLLEEEWDYLVALDVFEHIHTYELTNILGIVRAKNLLVRIPVADAVTHQFVLEVSRVDSTHVQIRTKEEWKSLLAEHGYARFEAVSETMIWDSPGVLSGVATR